MSVMTVRVVTPDKLVFDGEAERIFARGIDGDFAVLYNHIPMMTPLGVGELRIDMNGESSYIAIDNGIFEVSNNHVNVLSNDAMMAEDIDVARAKMDLERTERQKQNAKTREDLIKSEMEIVKLLNLLVFLNRQLSEGDRQLGPVHRHLKVG